MRLASPCWPVVSGSLQTALLRAENNAVKAGMAVCDYAKLKTATGGFSSRLYVRGGNCLGSGGNGNVFFLEITRNGEKSQVACKLIHQVRLTVDSGRNRMQCPYGVLVGISS